MTIILFCLKQERVFISCVIYLFKFLCFNYLCICHYIEYPPFIITINLLKYLK